MTSKLPEHIDRRTLLKAGVSSLACMSFGESVFAAEAENEEPVPFVDAPRARPGQLDWEELEDWITPQDQVFYVAHYGIPTMPEPSEYRLEISGEIERPQVFTLKQLQQLPKEDRLMTLECSGNGVSPGFMAAIYNAKFTGIPLSSFIKSLGLKDSAKELVFFGTDKKTEKFKDGKKEIPFDAYFARSMDVQEALQSNAILAYAANDKPLSKENGFPLRLIRPGYYGIANVKWINKIEVWDRRYMGKYMARAYVTLRGERHGDKIVYKETSIGKMNNKSIIARVTKKKNDSGKDSLKIYGAVWGHDSTRIKAVEIQIDGGKWVEATLDKQPRSQHSWIFFAYEWNNPAPGKHTLVSRAVDVNGHVQPTQEDDEIKLKKTIREAYQQYPRVIEI